MSAIFKLVHSAAGRALLLCAVLLASACGEQASAPQPTAETVAATAPESATGAVDAAAAVAYSGVLSGTVTYGERRPLPPTTTIVVRLLDVSQADAPAKVLAEQTIPAEGLSIPVAWSLEYDPALIDSRMSYAVRAEIRGPKGGVQWTTKTRHPVLTRGAPLEKVEIMVEKVKSQQAAGQPEAQPGS